MEKEVELVFTDEVIRLGASYFQLTNEQLENLGGFENYVFSAKQNHKEVILRFTHSSHRTYEQVKAEMAWLHFLQANHAPVCGPIPAMDGELVKIVPAEDTFFYVSLFEKARGNAVKVTDECFNEKLFFAWGKATGLLHKLSENYVENDDIVKRPDLVEEFQYQYEPFLPKDDDVKEKTHNVLNTIKQLPKTNDRYRLIHSDIHSGNFFYDGKSIIIFDFDDCSYHHIISDIAIPIYYSALYKYTYKKDRNEFINKTFFPEFIKGYRTEYELDHSLIKEIPMFLKLRDCELFGVLNKKWDLTALNDKQAALLQEIKERIANEQPIVDLDLYISENLT